MYHDLFKQSLKEIVHLKLKMLSFTHPKVVPNLWVSFFCWTQEKIFIQVWNNTRVS